MELIKAKSDFYTSVEKALQEIDPNWQKYPGLIVVGSHALENVEEKLQKIQEARATGTPFLGICFGFQLMLIEYARNVLGIKDATSEEIGPGTPIITKMPSLRVGLLPAAKQMESFWHNYKFNPLFTFDYREKWRLAFQDDVLVLAYLKSHPYFMGVQFHPEYQSTKDKPHLILKEFIHVCKTQMESNAGGFRGFTRKYLGY